MPSGSNVDERVRRAEGEAFVCKGNQEQLEPCLKVLEKLENATTLLDNNDVNSATRKLDDGTDIIQKPTKAIKIADKSGYAGPPFPSTFPMNWQPIQKTKNGFTGLRSEPKRNIKIDNAFVNRSLPK